VLFLQRLKWIFRQKFPSSSFPGIDEWKEGAQNVRRDGDDAAKCGKSAHFEGQKWVLSGEARVRNGSFSSSHFRLPKTMMLLWKKRLPASFRCFASRDLEPFPPSLQPRRKRRQVVLNNAQFHQNGVTLCIFFLFLGMVCPE